MGIEMNTRHNLKMISQMARTRYLNKARQVAFAWERFLEYQMSLQKTGQWHEKVKNGVHYSWQASAPGEYPAIVSQELLDSMYTTVTATEAQIQISLGFDTDYDEYLEEIRPLVRASYNEMRDKLKEMMHWNYKITNVDFEFE